MSKMKYPAVFFLVIVIISLLLPVIYYNRLPATVALHFNISNNADSRMNRETFLIIQLSTITILSIMIFLWSFLLPRLPKSLINLPNKDYWLSDEKKGETYSIFQRSMYWSGSFTLMLINLVIQEVYNANITGSSKISPSIWIYLAAYLIVSGFLLFNSIRYFKKHDQA
jgi:uncharacterized membrane protein